MKTILWDKKTNLFLPSGRECTPEEIFAEFPFTKRGTVVLEQDMDENTNAIYTLGQLAEMHGISTDLTPDQMLEEYARIKDAPAPEASPVVAELEHRIAELESALDTTVQAVSTMVAQSLGEEVSRSVLSKAAEDLSAVTKSPGKTVDNIILEVKKQ